MQGLDEASAAIKETKAGKKIDKDIERGIARAKKKALKARKDKKAARKARRAGETRSMQADNGGAMSEALGVPGEFAGGFMDALETCANATGEPC